MGWSVDVSYNCWVNPRATHLARPSLIAANVGRFRQAAGITLPGAIAEPLPTVAEPSQNDTLKSERATATNCEIAERLHSTEIRMN